jgi:hypothetical protein
MNVIGHDDVPTDCYSARFAFPGKFDEPQVHCRIREQFPAMPRIEGYKIQRRIVLLKYWIQPEGLSAMQQIWRCRGACAKRLFRRISLRLDGGRSQSSVSCC